MPRSKNRRYLEIPTALYESLETQAAAEQRPVSAIVADLIVDGQTVRDYLVPMETDLREIRRELAQLRLALEKRLPPWPLPAIDAPTGPPARTILE